MSHWLSLGLHFFFCRMGARSRRQRWDGGWKEGHSGLIQSVTVFGNWICRLWTKRGGPWRSDQGMFLMSDREPWKVSRSVLARVSWAAITNSRKVHA